MRGPFCVALAGFCCFNSRRSCCFSKIVSTSLRLFNMEEGTFLWARFPTKYWPAISVNAEEAGMKKPAPGTTIVYWFGDARISVFETKQERSSEHEDPTLNKSVIYNLCELNPWTYCIQQVTLRNCVPFAARFDMYSLQVNDMGQKWKAGVVEAIKFYSNLEHDVPYEYALDVAYKTYHLPTHNVNKYVPENVRVQLTKRLLTIWTHYNTAKQMANLMECINAGRSIKELCLACYTKVTCMEHPIFEGNLCTNCRDKLYHTIYGVDRQNYCYCVICGNNIHLVKCHNKSCKRTYCSQCLKNLKVRVPKTNWTCLICVPEQTHFTKVRPNYPVRVLQFLAPNAQLKTITNIDPINTNMLVVFHGKCKALDILSPGEDLLPLDDRDSLLGFATIKGLEFGYLKAHFVDLIRGPNASVRMYYQREIDIKKIKELGQIGVIIGGTSYPAVGIKRFNDNFQTKLFWEFNRMQHLLKMLNAEREFPFKFVFELHSTITKSFLDVISRYLGTEPFLFEAAGAKEPRLVWTNYDCH